MRRWFERSVVGVACIRALAEAGDLEALGREAHSVRAADSLLGVCHLAGTLDALRCKRGPDVQIMAARNRVQAGMRNTRVSTQQQRGGTYEASTMLRFPA